MKLSNVTLAVLKNFAQINPAIKIEAGNVLKSINTAQSFLAEATVPDSFPVSFAIYDLNDFISAVNLVADGEFDFRENWVEVKNAAGYRIRYTYAAPEVIRFELPKGSAPPESLCVPADKNALHSVISACRSLGLPELRLAGTQDGVLASAYNSKNATANQFEVRLSSEPVPDHANFDLTINAAVLKMLPLPYSVALCGRVVKFKYEDDGWKLSYMTPSINH